MYDRLSHTWWDEDGFLNILRSGLNPSRFAYMRRILTRTLGLEPDGLRILDVGCGGGLVGDRLGRARPPRLRDVHPARRGRGPHATRRAGGARPRRLQPRQPAGGLPGDVGPGPREDHLRGDGRAPAPPGEPRHLVVLRRLRAQARILRRRPWRPPTLRICCCWSPTS